MKLVKLYDKQYFYPVYIAAEVNKIVLEISFLFSSVSQYDKENHISYLLCEHDEFIIGDNINLSDYSNFIITPKHNIENHIKQDNISSIYDKKMIIENKKQYFTELVQNFVYGYIGYEYFYNLFPEIINLDVKESFISKNFPKCYLAKYKNIIIFDHNQQQIYFFSKDNIVNIKRLEKIIDNITCTSNNQILSTYASKIISDLDSNMTDQEYYEKLLMIQEHIRIGDIYQTNLTRKYFAEFRQNLDNIGLYNLFIKGIEKYKVSYSCFVKFQDKYMLSFSPERFISLTTKNGNNILEAIPIKGTCPKRKGIFKLIQNLIQKYRLILSTKEKAENLMIVDLLRNDLSKIAQEGSIRVTKLFSVLNYEHIYHLCSVINAKLKQNLNAFDIINNSFPPGSMTGAPKYNSIRIGQKIEGYNRGVFSGINFIVNGLGEFESSVIIRTILIYNQHCEFQVGGGITYLSKPKQELAEIHHKSRPMIYTLGYNNKS